MVSGESLSRGTVQVHGVDGQVLPADGKRRGGNVVQRKSSGGIHQVHALRDDHGQVRVSPAGTAVAGRTGKGSGTGSPGMQDTRKPGS